METIHIGELEARYRLPPWSVGEQGRLDRLLRWTLDEALEGALEEAGVPVAEEICVREIYVPVRLKLSASDRALMLEWSGAVAHSIRAALDSGRTDRVVRYASRRQGLVDFAIGVARGRLGRAWAWRQMGFGEISENASPRQAGGFLERALLGEPTAIVPVLAAVAEQGDLGWLAQRLAPESWPGFAIAALKASGVDGDRLRREAHEARSFADADRRLRGRAQRLVGASRLARAAIGQPFGLLDPPNVRSAFAALVVLEVEAGGLRGGEQENALLLAATEERIAELARGNVEGRGGKAEGAGGPAPEANLARSRAAPDRREGDVRPLADGSQPSAEDRVWAAEPTESEAHADARRPKQPATGLPELGGTAQRTEPAPDVAEESPVHVVRQRGFTECGGLLFLVHVLEDVALFDEIAASDLARRRPFRWILHRLALVLFPMEENDPAALAFAGLGPEARPPRGDEEPADEEELEVVIGWAGRLVDALRERLGWLDVTAPVLLERVCRRRAQVVADPGWIEIRLSLEDVSTEIRRVRLDLDPGFVPWLGVVLRFVYE